MKRILLSILTIGLVSAAVFGATKAFFTDTEKSEGNTFSAGTIDIAVDGQNPWSRTTPYKFEDMKPSQMEYANFLIKNVGSNAVNVWKRIDITSQEDGEVTEQECTESNGTWSNGECSGEYLAKNDISSAVRYDLVVWVYDADPNQNPDIAPKWWQIIYTDEMNKRLNTLDGQDVLLGMVPAGWYMKVQQSYHMDANTSNWAQGDVMTFDITLTAEQLKGTVWMENKDSTGDRWLVLGDDDIKGVLTYGVRDSKFSYTFSGKAPLPGTKYWLIEYKDPWGTPGRTFGSAISDGSGNLNITGSKELNSNLINAKIWLVTDTDYDEVANKLTGWNPNDYLFELGLMDYYDADL